MMLNIKERKLGITFDSLGKAEIMVWAPLLKNVELTLSEKKISLPLEKDVLGYWKGHTELLKPYDKYKFILDGEKERPDPASLSQPEGVHGVSEAIDTKEFKWTDANWKNIPLENFIIYELHAGTFTNEENFQGIEQKLDYLKELGITAIELMPLAQFPGNRNWGYDGVFPFAVQNSYGGAKALQSLIDICHQKNLAVVLDVVYNHIGPEGNYMGDFAPYFTSKYNTPWGNAINFDDAWCDGVRHFFLENVLMWFRDFHIDALRMDAVHAIKDFSPKHILKEIKEHVDLLKKETGREHYLIVELDLNDTKFIDPVEDHGYGMDAQWIDEFHHALRVVTGEPRTGYYEDFDGLKHLAKSYKDAYVYDGIYSFHRHKTFGIKADKNPGKQFVVFSQNHDQVGNRMLGERTSKLVSFEMQKLMAGAVMVSPYLPMLFMGEEYGETNPFLYFVSHTDPALVEAVRKGRKAEFAAFHTQGEAPDPQSEKTFEQSKLQWDLLTKDPHNVLFQYYTSLIALRKKNKVLNQLSRKQQEVHAFATQQTLLLNRWHEDEHIWCILNFSKQQQNINLPSNGVQYKNVFDSADPVWNGPKASLNFISTNILVQPESLLIYST
jgi:maltooligosyltrehalose trehalohydrolase